MEGNISTTSPHKVRGEIEGARVGLRVGLSENEGEKVGGSVSDDRGETGTREGVVVGN